MKPYVVNAVVALLLSVPMCALAAPAFDPEQAARAKKLFVQRCQAAGERIDQTVDGVDGVLLLKIRPTAINYGDQFRLDDPYGRDFRGDGYIENFLSAHHELPRIYRRLWESPPPETSPSQIGYTFVDVVDAATSVRLRYTATIEQPGKTDRRFSPNYYRVVLSSAPAPEPSPRYGVTYDDISTPEDRAHWIAGSSLKVIDLQERKVIAERIGYMFDPGQGRGGRGSPW
ncbi:MAG: hypothetical protein ACREWI_06420, partial [Telluria sp.]